MRPWQKVWSALLVVMVSGCVSSSSAPETVGVTTRPTAPTQPTTLPTLDPATQELDVTSAPIDLVPEVLEATEGMVLGAIREFVFDDGTPGGGPIVIRVQGGEAQMIRGRWCGTEWGPPPLDDLMGGVVVASFEPGYEVVRCVPGREVETLLGAGSPAQTALIDGRPVLATISWSGPDRPSKVDLIDLDTMEAAPLFEVDPTADVPIAASRSKDGIWVLTLAKEADFSATVVRYVFLNDQGGLVDSPHNPQPEHPTEDSGLGAAALTPDGSRLLTLKRAEDNETELIIWDVETGSELARYRVLDALADDPETPWPEGRFASSVFASDTRAVVNVTAIAEELHPHGMVVVDLSSGGLTEISGRRGDVAITLGSFIHP